MTEAMMLRALRERHGRFVVAVDEDGRCHVHVGEAPPATRPLASGATLPDALRAAMRRRVEGRLQRAG